MLDLLDCETGHIQLEGELKVIIDFVASHRLEIPVESFESDDEQRWQFRQ
jgi:hypothetical protein